MSYRFAPGKSVYAVEIDQNCFLQVENQEVKNLESEIAALKTQLKIQELKKEKEELMKKLNKQL